MDFFVTVPGDRPAISDSWQETVRTSVSGIPESTPAHETVRTFTIRGDTVFEGMPALVIDVVSEVSLESTGPMEGQPVTLTTLLRGSDTGLVVFDFDAGRLLYRTKSGELSGSFQMVGGGQSMEFPQNYDLRIKHSTHGSKHPCSLTN